MAKETSDSYKSRMRFNEQVNFILLIMFLSVALIISIRGCGGSVCSHNLDGEGVPTSENNTVNNSIGDGSAEAEK